MIIIYYIINFNFVSSIGEEDFIKERDDTAPGHEWQRICRLCDFRYLMITNLIIHVY